MVRVDASWWNWFCTIYTTARFRRCDTCVKDLVTALSQRLRVALFSVWSSIMRRSRTWLSKVSYRSSLIPLMNSMAGTSRAGSTHAACIPPYTHTIRCGSGVKPRPRIASMGKCVLPHCVGPANTTVVGCLKKNRDCLCGHVIGFISTTERA
jgi:hypothetical protein